MKIDLPPEMSGERPQGPVSVAQLRHQPSQRALHAALKAGKLSEAGDYRGAATQLEKAVAFDPQFAEAHGNLGAQYLRLHEPEEAAQEFRRALELDPASAPQQANLALVLAQLGKTEEAAHWSRRALQTDSTNALAHYVLGCLLVGHAATFAEGAHHLELAAHELPAAAHTLESLRQRLESH